MKKLGILSENQKIEHQVDFERLFKNIWADHADVISTQYSGTGALKTDFTRTGKRTKAGLLQDGLNSLVRYYKNNLSDGFRQVGKVTFNIEFLITTSKHSQDAIDLFLGNYIIEEGRPTPRSERGWKYLVVCVSSKFL